VDALRKSEANVHTSYIAQIRSKNDVLVVFVTQHVLALGCIFLSLCTLLRILLLQPSSLFDCGISLLLAGDFLEAVKLLSVQLVELGVDVLDGVLCTWDDDMFAAAVSTGIALEVKVPTWRLHGD